MIPVIIPAFRSPERLSRCLASVALQDCPVENYVRDNSTDNILYTAAVNEGLRKYAYGGEADFLLVLTQDCYLKENCLVNLAAYMESNPRCGIAAPLQLSAEGATTWAGSLDAWPAGVHVQNAAAEFPGPMKTYWASGACFLVRAECVRDVGLLDENMRFICSDSDYSLTARSRGWDVVMVPSAQAEHECDESAKVSAPWLQRIKINDMRYFTQKWLSGGLFQDLAYEGKNITGEAVLQYLTALQAAEAALPQE